MYLDIFLVCVFELHTKKYIDIFTSQKLKHFIFKKGGSMFFSKLTSEQI
jgi:hypothetical protein